uniref:GNAT family N-acetyltransferase n=1 Tax=Enterococcus mundtii TaxID=53346 RepID=UPI0021B145AF|nr:GNAT family N-acetyltransferase [Enterococcus mundtii]
MIRTARVEDAETINKLNKEELGYEIPLSEMTKQLECILAQPEIYVVDVYEEEGTKKVLGYVHAQKYETLLSPTLFNILALAVSSKVQYQGIGRRLMESVEKEGTERGYFGVRLNSGEHRNEAHLFYERIGYHSTKWQKQFLKEFLNE